MGRAGGGRPAQPGAARRGVEPAARHLAARRAIDAALEPALADAVSSLPLPVRVGAVACFGRGPYVLVRVVVANRALLDLQVRVTAALGPDPRTAHHFAPGNWTPHVSLARRLTADQVGRALAALGATPDLDGRAVACRRWDGDARREWRLRSRRRVNIR